MDHPPAPLPPPQFSLRSMLIGITLLCVGLGICLWLTPPAVVAVLVAVLMVGAHVFGNAVGTRLRNGKQDRVHPANQFKTGIDYDAGSTAAPSTHLAERWSLGWLLTVPTTAGTLLSVIGGCLWIEHAYQLGFDPGGMAVAGAGFGLLGGFASFAVASFSQVLVVAVFQAMRHK